MNERNITLRLLLFIFACLVLNFSYGQTNKCGFTSWNMGYDNWEPYKLELVVDGLPTIQEFDLANYDFGSGGIYGPAIFAGFVIEETADILVRASHIENGVLKNNCGRIALWECYVDDGTKQISRWHESYDTGGIYSDRLLEMPGAEWRYYECFTNLAPGMYSIFFQSVPTSHESYVNPIGIEVYAISKKGNSRDNPINIGTYGGSFDYNSTKNSILYDSGDNGSGVANIYYQFEMLRPFDVYASDCGTDFSSYFVMTGPTTLGWTSDPNCDGANALIGNNLPAGVYTISHSLHTYAGQKDMFLSLSVTSGELAGNSMDNPIELGTITESNIFSKTYNTAYYDNNYHAYPGRDFFVKFTTTSPSSVKVLHFPSAGLETYAAVLGPTGNLMVDSRNSPLPECDNTSIYITELPAGTYYLVTDEMSGSGELEKILEFNFDERDRDYSIFLPTSTKNYIVSVQPTVSTLRIDTLGVNSVMKNVQYYDLLGRPVQSLDWGASPLGRDVVSYTEYDRHDRVYKEWLPTVHSSSGRFKGQSEIGVKSLADHAGDNKAFILTIYDESFLQRPLRIYGPGKVMHDNDHYIESGYLVNDLLDNTLHKWKVSGDRNSHILEYGGVYDPGSLLVFSNENEDGHITYTFRDHNGRTILERSLNGSLKYDTYYVYDYYGNICYVLPPTISTTITEVVLDSYAYRYKYDHRNRCIEKKLPGVEPIFYAYDERDRLVRSQDGQMRISSRWLYYTYDDHNRLVNVKVGATSTGIVQTNQLQVSYDPVLETYTYDTYNGVPTGLAFMADDISESYDPRVKTLLTYEKKAIVDSHEITNYDFIERAYYYDYQGRIVQRVEQNHLGGISRTSIKYDFVGNVLTMQESHQTSSSSEPDILRTNYSYDHRGRVLSEETILNDGVPARVDYAYDELGKLKEKTYGGDLGLKESYTYNIQGWETSRRNDLFNMNLRYYDPDNGAEPQYGGNISEWHWTHITPPPPGSAATLVEPNAYAFSYDGLNRLMDTKRFSGLGSVFDDPVEILSKTEKDLSYDLNGNILGLTRYGSTISDTPDELDYTYTGNQLTTLSRNGRDYNYRYDANGNCVYDGYNNLDIEYNYLNLTSGIFKNFSVDIGVIEKPGGGTIVDPGESVIIDPGGGSTGGKNPPGGGGEILPPGGGGVIVDPQPAYAKRIKYTWLADGTKLSVNDGTNGYEYLGSLIYKYNSLGGLSVESAPFGGGRIIAVEGRFGTEYNPQYYLTDHLGSPRVIVNHTGGVEGRMNYYPFGKLWEGGQAPVTRWNYNGKETQEITGTNLLDYGARQYDPDLLRWKAVDPLAEKYYSMSPYNYVAGNPIKYIDPDGRWVDGFTVDEYGFIEHVDGTGGKNFDVIYRKDDYQKGKRDYDETGTKTGLKVDSQFMASHKTTILKEIDGETGIRTGKSHFLERYTMDDDTKATAIFEFLSRNTEVEWGNRLLQHNTGSTLNLIYTSHERTRISSGWEMYYRHFFLNGYETTIRADHSHPDGFQPSDNDILNKKLSPSTKFRIYFGSKYYPY